MKTVWMVLAIVFLITTVSLLVLAGLLLYGMKIENDEHNRVTAANFSAANINVIRDHELKRVRLFAVTKAASTITDIDAWRIEVVSNPEIIAQHQKFSGSYHNHHNRLVLNVAAVHILEGDRDLGLYLIRTLAGIEPTFEWSHPTLGNRSIQRILQGVEADDGSMQDFLDSEMVQWKWRTREYGTPARSLETEPTTQRG